MADSLGAPVDDDDAVSPSGPTLERLSNTGRRLPGVSSFAGSLGLGDATGVEAPLPGEAGEPPATAAAMGRTVAGLAFAEAEAEALRVAPAAEAARLEAPPALLREVAAAMAVAAMERVAVGLPGVEAAAAGARLAARGVEAATFPAAPAAVVQGRRQWMVAASL